MCDRNFTQGTLGFSRASRCSLISSLFSQHEGLICQSLSSKVTEEPMDDLREFSIVFLQNLCHVRDKKATAETMVIACFLFQAFKYA